jgi:hypothetical protein
MFLSHNPSLPGLNLAPFPGKDQCPDATLEHRCKAPSSSALHTRTSTPTTKKS